MRYENSPIVQAGQLVVSPPSAARDGSTSTPEADGEQQRDGKQYACAPAQDGVIFHDAASVGWIAVRQTGGRLEP
ncbi:hypothetical protein [Rhodanobacter sp. MP1X3]|uniref:hypothetical protein n=1 Tax=Rhodanobacter sp. MP1X3 TaxID=2723086 RepID=UPI001621F72D|nr:hypothetical protein [Rhodanobacter sp. MP1X3]